MMWSRRNLETKEYRLEEEEENKKNEEEKDTVCFLIIFWKPSRIKLNCDIYI